MKRYPSIALAHRQSQYLTTALVAAIVIQVCLYINSSGDNPYFNPGPAVVEILYMVSLLLLVGVVCSRHIYNTKAMRRAQAGREQLDAMISMFSSVKHKLNNDMQVVLGNAELAEILVNGGGDLSKPVQNITAAANHAVERIEQLSVFGTTGLPNPTSVDLNAMFRQSMAKLAEELPPIVTLRLDLEPLSARVLVDRYLLSLSLSHLVRLAVTSMRHGGEIVVRTLDSNDRGDTYANTVVARIHIVRALSHSSISEDRSALAIGDHENPESDQDVEICQNGLQTIKSLVERSGVKSVKLTRACEESLFTMCFATDDHLKPCKVDVTVSQFQSS